MAQVIRIHPVGEADILTKETDQQRVGKIDPGNGTESLMFISAKHSKLFRPMLYSMKIVGLHFERAESTKNQGVRMIQQIYCLAVTTILGLNLCRMVSMFNSTDGFHPVTIQKLILITWLLNTFCDAAACFRASYVKFCLPDFFQQLNKITSINKSDVHSDTLKRTVAVFTLAAWFNVVINTLYVTYCLFFSDVLNSLLTPFSLNAPYIHVIKAVAIIIHFYSTASLMLSVFWRTLICIVLKTKFAECNQLFKNLLTKGSDYQYGDFKSCYDRYQAVHQLLYHAEDAFSFMHGVLFVSNIGLMCLILYNLISYSAIISDPMVSGMHVAWLFGSVIVLGTACIGGTIVNKAVSGV